MDVSVTSTMNVFQLNVLAHNVYQTVLYLLFLLPQILLMVVSVQITLNAHLAIVTPLTNVHLHAQLLKPLVNILMVATAQIVQNVVLSIALVQTLANQIVMLQSQEVLIMIPVTVQPTRNVPLVSAQTICASLLAMLLK